MRRDRDAEVEAALPEAVVVRVRDAVSAIQKLEYSLSGGAWQPVFPADGVADSPEERFEIPLANEADAARMVVRAVDWLQNATSVTVAVK